MADHSRERLHRMVQGLALATAVVGGLALIGWQIDSPLLKSGLQGVSMNPLTAVLCILTGAGIVSLPMEGHSARQRLACTIGVVVAGVSALKIISFFGWDVSLDDLFFRSDLASNPIQPNRMAPNTTICFLLLGTALILVSSRRNWAAPATQSLALVAAYIGFQSLIGYCFGIAGVFEVPSFIPMALNSAIATTLASIGLLLAEPDLGFIGELTKDRAGGIVARRMLPLAILIPVGIGWLRYKGQQAQFYSNEVGVTLMITAMVVTLITAIWWNAKHLNHYDNKVHDIMKDLARLNLELESFSYSVSHDLRAPLRSVAGFSNILLEDHSSSLNDEAKGYLGRIANAAERMGKLIDGLLNLSRLSRKEMRVEAVNLTRAAETVLSDLRSIYPDHSPVTELQPNITAMGDPDLLLVVLQNLLGNAWKFSSRTAAAKIEFGMTETSNGFAYFVRDNGAGFDMEHSKNLFGAFQRLHSMTEFEGTGIGLATVQRVIMRHGGTIWVDAKPGQGATFYFTLKCMKDKMGIHDDQSKNRSTR